MLNNFIKYIHDVLFYVPKQRQINPDYFLDVKQKNDYCKNGYVIIENVVTEDAIQIIEETYALLKKSKTYFEAEGFITSPNYGEEIQQTVTKNLIKVNRIILPKFLDIKKCVYDYFSLLVIKFNTDKSYVEPHQDVAMIDETISTSSYLWIPTQDINETNGALLVLPGSHIWAGWQKTHNREITPLKKNSKWLLSKMIPLFLKKGDLIMFDASLIHGSMPNISERERIAMNTSIISKNIPMVHYEKNPATPKGMVEKYNIDLNFWKNTEYIQSIAGKNKNVVLEILLREKQLSKWNLNALNKKFNPLLNKEY